MDKRLYILYLAIFIDLLGFGIVIPVLPSYVQELGGHGYLVGIVAASFSIMSFFFTPIWGSLSDKFGRRPILLLTILFSTLAYGSLYFASSLTVLLLSRIFSGIGSGNISVAQAFIVDTTPPEKRVKAMGMIGAAFSLGFIFGPPVGGFVKEAYGFGALGIVVGALCLVNLIIAWFWLPESIYQKNRELKIKLIPFNDLIKSLEIPGRRQIFLFNLIYITAFFMFQITGTLVWEEKYGFDASQISLIFSLIGLCSAIMQGGLAGLFNRWLGEFKLIFLGSFMLMFALATISFVQPGWFFYLEIPLIILIVVANGFVGPASISILSRITNPKEQGKTLGLFQSYGALARSVGPLVGGMLFDVDMHLPYLFGAAILIVGVFLASSLGKFLQEEKASANIVPSPTENPSPSHP